LPQVQSRGQRPTARFSNDSEYNKQNFAHGYKYQLP
jgi:hypothetical protein